MKKAKKITSMLLACLLTGTTGVFASGCEAEVIQSLISGVLSGNSVVERQSTQDSAGETQVENSQSTQDGSEGDLVENIEIDHIDVAERKPSEGLTYELSDDGTYYTMTGMGTCMDSYLVIPSEYKGLPVKNIATLDLVDESFVEFVKIMTARGRGGSVPTDEEALQYMVNELGWKSPKVKIEGLIIPDSVEMLNSDTGIFLMSLKELYMGANVDLNTCISAPSLEKVAFSEDSNYVGIKGNIYTRDKKTLVRCINGDIAACVENVDKGAFMFSAIDNIDAIASKTSIADCRFIGCKNLKSITIPDGVTSIPYLAFAGCTSLTEVVIPDSVTSVGIGAFYNTGYYNDRSNWKDDVLYIGNFLLEAKPTISGDYAVKKGTVVITAMAFMDCEELTGINIPDSVCVIGESAFAGCTNLKDIRVSSNNVIKVKEFAFSDTAYYKNESNYENGMLYIGKCLIGISIKGISAFASIKDGTVAIVPGGGVAFAFVNDVSITIPESVKYIGADGLGFYDDHYDNKVTIIFNGTVEQWNLIEKEEYWYPDNLVQIICSDGMAHLPQGLIEE